MTRHSFITFLALSGLNSTSSNWKQNYQRKASSGSYPANRKSHDQKLCICINLICVKKLTILIYTTIHFWLIMSCGTYVNRWKWLYALNPLSRVREESGYSCGRVEMTLHIKSVESCRRRIRIFMGTDRNDSRCTFGHINSQEYWFYVKGKTAIACINKTNLNKS